MSGERTPTGQAAEGTVTPTGAIVGEPEADYGDTYPGGDRRGT